MLYCLWSSSAVAFAPSRTVGRRSTELEAKSWLQTAVSHSIVGLSLLALSNSPALAAGSSSPRYWTIQGQGDVSERLTANKALLDYTVGTINTMYYDPSGGAYFDSRSFYQTFRERLQTSVDLDTRKGVEADMRYLIDQLHDPYSKYLTRQQLQDELKPQSQQGFLGMGALLVEAGPVRQPTLAQIPVDLVSSKRVLYSATQVQHLPVVAALAAHSPAERLGLSVGDKIVAVGSDSWLRLSPSQLKSRLAAVSKETSSTTEITIAHPVYMSSDVHREVVVAYRPIRLKLNPSADAPAPTLVQSQLLTPEQSLFGPNERVGYIRVTRFSRAATEAYIQAIQSLESQGATSYIIDLRNNYGGVIQEAMLMASSLLRDPHAVLCYTLNSRGGFTPHDVEEYVVDRRYPGYLLSRESPSSTRDQVQRESPEFWTGRGWSPPSAYASLREQSVHRGIRRTTKQQQELQAQKNVVVLINEGTASAAEVFASALHDNGRTVALVGTKTYGKG